MVKKIRSLSILITIIVMCLENSFAQSNWYHITSPGDGKTIFFIDSLKGWVGGNDGIFRTIDGGTTWTSQILPVWDQISRIKFISPNIGFAVGSNGSIFKTTNAGITWLLKRSGVSLNSIFFIDNQNGWACGGDTVLKTTNQGETWVARSAYSALGLWDVSFRNSTEGWVVGLYNGCYKSTDAGDSWNAINPPFPGKALTSICFPSSSRGIIVAGDQIALSTDAGNSWNSVYNNGSSLNSVSFADSLNGWVVGTDKIVRTTNGGFTWYEQSLPSLYEYLKSVYSFNKQYVWAVGYTDILKTIDGGGIPSIPSIAPWIPTHTFVGKPNLNWLVSSGTSLFAGGDSVIFRSTNDGTSWATISSGISFKSSYAFSIFTTLAIIDSNIFVGTSGDGVFRSTNNGLNWIETNNGLTSQYISSFAVIGNNLFAGTGNGVFRSTNNGLNWVAANGGLTINFSPFAVLGNNLFAGTWDQGVFLSTDNGDSWTALSTDIIGSDITSLIAFYNEMGDINLFASVSLGNGHIKGITNPMFIYKSTNNGKNWTSLTNGYFLTVYGTNIFAVPTVFGGGVILSTNNGIYWNDCSAGLTDRYVTALAVSGTNLFASTYNSIWRRPLAAMITSVKKYSTNLPTQFNLDQNYPNPFNSATNISFSIPSKSFVSLKVYDILGREVSTITSKEMSEGRHLIQWNALNKPSGIYFYRLQVGSYSETKKLILLK